MEPARASSADIHPSAIETENKSTRDRVCMCKCMSMCICMVSVCTCACLEYVEGKSLCITAASWEEQSPSNGVRLAHASALLVPKRGLG